MAVSSLVTGGVGPGSTIPLLLTLGLAAGEAVEPPVVVAESATGGWYRYDPPERSRKEDDDERRKLGIIADEIVEAAEAIIDEAAPQEIAAPQSLVIDFDFDRIASQVAKIAKNEREQREFEELAYLLAVSEAKKRQDDAEIMSIVRFLYTMVQ